MLSTARISLNVDGDVKQNAQRVLSEIGMDLTTAINLFLRTVVREESIPFDLRTESAYQEEVYKRYVLAELEKSKIEADDPATQLLSHDDMMARLRQQREARNEL